MRKVNNIAENSNATKPDRLPLKKITEIKIMDIIPAAKAGSFFVQESHKVQTTPT
jgi:hypothetical protein